MGLLNSALSFIGDYGDDILGIGGVAASIWGTTQTAGAIRDTGQAQAVELRRTAQLNADNTIWTAEQNAKLLEYDQEVARHQAELIFQDAEDKLELIDQDMNEQIRQHAINVNAMMGIQKASYGKAGVSTKTGSALDVMKYTAKEGLRDAQNIRKSAGLLKEQIKTTTKGELYNRQSLIQRLENEKVTSLDAAARAANIIEQSASSQAALSIASSSSQATATMYSGFASASSGLYNLGEKYGIWG